MTKRKHAGLAQNILKLVLIIPAMLGVTTRLVSLLRIEMHNVRKKIIFAVFLVITCLVLFTSVWLGLSSILFFYLLSLKLGLILSATITLIGNFLLLVIACLWLALLKIDLSFPKTRKDIKKLIMD